MKKLLIIFSVFLLFSSMKNESGFEYTRSYEDGEFLKYRIHYMGLTAGYATLNLSTKNYNGSSHFHAVGKGWTTGATKLFFKVEDRYETYINKSTNLPSKFVRKVNEGGYIKDKVITFNQSSKRVTVKDNKYNTNRTYKVSSQVQDMLSSFYYLRQMSPNSLTNGSVKTIKVFMDEEIYPFKVKVMGRETLKTKYGNVKTIKIRPYVQSGRVFKEDESVTFWVTDDENLMPVLIKADLVVGSLKAEIHGFDNLSKPISVQ